MTIDLNKLREYYRASKDAHGALLSASDRYREALTVRRRAMDAFARFVNVPRLDPDDVLKEAKNASVETGRAPKDAEKVAAAKALLEAQKPFEIAEEEVRRIQQKSNHAGRIWVRCRDYASELGKLPADMEN